MNKIEEVSSPMDLILSGMRVDIVEQKWVVTYKIKVRRLFKTGNIGRLTQKDQVPKMLRFRRVKIRSR